MPRYFVGGAILLLTLLVVGGGCRVFDTKIEQDVKPKVAASIFPAYDLVQEVAGDDIDVILLIEPGTSPHYFEPTVAQLRDLQGAQAIFTIGVGFDEWVDNIIHNIDGAKEVMLSTGIPLRESAHAHDHEDELGDDTHNDDEHLTNADDRQHENKRDTPEENIDDEHGPVDPHYWLSPRNAVVMVDTITRELSQLLPEKAARFEARSAAFKQHLDQKDRQWQTAMRALPKKELITFHDAFGYFAQHFGLDVVATFEPFAGKEPTLKYLANLREEIIEHGIAHLFLEPQLSTASLETFASDNGVELGVLDPVGGVSGRDSYMSLIDFNVRQIVQSLEK